MRTVVALLPLIVLAGCGPQKESLGRTRAAPPALTISTLLTGPAGEPRGTARLSQLTDGVEVTVTVQGLPPGTFGVHLHAVGKCEAPGFTTAGPHFNPGIKQHGRDNPSGAHMGDLPNVDTSGDGTGRMDFVVPGLRLADGPTPLLDTDGAAILVHAGEDDYKTDPSGNSGARIACGSFGGRAASTK